MLHRALISVLLAALIAAPGVVHAQGATAEPGQPNRPEPPAALVAERQKLRTELDRVNAEIDGLKREKRGLGDDYRLRRRMADAEALARRLSELEAHLGLANRPGAGQGNAAWPSAPQASPSDDRADLEAKADILSDQSRRLHQQADVLAGRVTDLRGRQELRRRAGQLERDPFSPLEQGKRRIATGTPVPSGNQPRGQNPTGAGPEGFDVATPTAGPTAPTTATDAPPAPGLAGGAAIQPGKSTSTTTGSFANRIPSLVGSGSTLDNPGSVASQFRGILDAATLAEIRRLENPGSPTANLQAMERALSALRARAAQLATNASVLRNQAQSTR